ncbi:hypothetical protein V6N12_008792 [Hibiscus sabdariffa]|uniref:Uncharacterized protein n=1 Tax=Hibiscus sabdariffa TaxID=183260 RepID=A0ABR2C3T2_9ROSI
MQHLLRVVLVVGILHGLEAYSTSCRNGCSAGNVDQGNFVSSTPTRILVFTLLNTDENQSVEERSEWMGEGYLLHLFDYEIENKSSCKLMKERTYSSLALLSYAVFHKGCSIRSLERTLAYIATQPLPQ